MKAREVALAVIAASSADSAVPMICRIPVPAWVAVSTEPGSGSPISSPAWSRTRLDFAVCA